MARGSSKKPAGARKVAKPIAGKKPRTPHDGRVYQAGGGLKGSPGVSAGNLGKGGSRKTLNKV